MDQSNNDLRSLRRYMPGFLRSLVLPGLAAILGGAATASSVKEWYPTLRKPAFTPPSFVFGPAWTVLYILMGVADHVIAQSGDTKEIRHARSINRIQVVLNGLWSFLFFGRQSPLAGLIEIGFLWVAIVRTILAFYRISRLAALLLVPYLLWVSFAAILNASIWRLNR